MVTLLDSTGINTCTGSMTGLVLKNLSRDFSQRKPGPQVKNQLAEEPFGTSQLSADRRVVGETNQKVPAGVDPEEEENVQRHAYDDDTALLKADPELRL